MAVRDRILSFTREKQADPMSAYYSNPYSLMAPGSYFGDVPLTQQHLADPSVSARGLYGENPHADSTWNFMPGLGLGILGIMGLRQAGKWLKRRPGIGAAFSHGKPAFKPTSQPVIPGPNQRPVIPGPTTIPAIPAPKPVFHKAGFKREPR